MTEEESHYGLLSLVIAVAIGVVVGGIALSTVFWLIGGLLHLVFFLLRVASIVALGAFVVWLISRRKARAHY